MDQKEYILLKVQAKLSLKEVKQPYKQSLVRTAYKVSKALFSGKERLIGFWNAILINSQVVKGWK